MSPKERASAVRERGPMLSVVIPALNEERAIGDIVSRTLAVLDSLTAAGIADLELIVVDDGSTDRTAAIAESHEGVRVIRHDVNRGYGAALKTGLSAATGELIAFLDADGTYPPEAFPDLCTAALGGADVVIGSRMGSAESGMPRSRRLGNRIFATLVSLLTGQRVRDSASGMRVFRRERMPHLLPLPDGLNFTPIMSVRALQEGLTVVEVPIVYRERVGQSKLSVVRDGARFAQSILWTALGYNPARVLGILGLAGLSTTAAVAVGVVAARLRGVTELGPWGVAAIYAALVAGVAGVSLLSLGITFNYLVALFRRQPVRAGVFGRPLFDPPLDRHFGWFGALTAGLGIAVAVVALALGVHGWDVPRLWFYLAGSACLILVGLQLVISWVVMRILEELSQRPGA